MKIVIADDHSLFRELMGASLGHMFPGTIVYQAKNAADAISKVNDNRPDVVLLDLHMEGLCSFEAARKIKETYPQIKIAFLTGAAEANLVLRSRDLKLNGYILKGDSSKELKTALEIIVRGGYYIPPCFSDLLLDPNVVQRLRKNPLTEREIQIVSLLFGQSLTVKECATTLGIAEKTVESHRHSISKKLNNPTRAQLTCFCIEQNLVSKAQLRMPDLSFDSVYAV